jgi:RimJ/RimL family protein N-acetyltransferase
MLHGKRVTLRARATSDVDVLTAELHDDVATRSRAAGTAWRPLALGERSPFGLQEPRPDIAEFSVVELASGELLGAALLWGIDSHNRSAHFGISLRPKHRGQGFGTDVLEVLCEYSFMSLGLHRVQLETLADNPAMIGAARSVGFTHEGTMSESAWVSGQFHDDVVYGLLAPDWIAARPAERPAPS